MDSTISLWKSISKNPVAYPNLTTEIEVDVAIIGGGITGVTTALHLINAGKKVAIVEANKIGEGTTGFSTGNLYVPVQSYYQNVIKKFNEKIAKSVADSRKFAIDYIEKVVKEKNIQCHFSRRPWFLYTENNDHLSFLEKEVETLKTLDFDIDYVTDMPLFYKFTKAAKMDNQARFNPLQYVISLAENLQKQGCLIFENSRVIHVSENDTCRIETQDGKIFAKQAIIATHTPIGVNLSQVFTAPYRSYAVAVELSGNEYPEGHFWDLNSPHHATCTHSIHSDKPEVLVVAGNHHKVGQETNAAAHFSELEHFLRNQFPVTDVVYKWSAQHYQTADEVPYIGLASRSSKNTYLATGFFADGLLYGTLAGLILGDMILNKENPLEKTYNSNRFTPLASTPFLLKENGNVFFQYLKDLPFISSNKFDDIKIGEGKVVEMEQEKWAVSRDEQNQLHIVSAVCTHMKCIVNWNNAENTWDCPCHGSRFKQTGEVIEGPAQINLKKKES